MTQALAYSDTSVARRHGPIGYANYESYRPWLRDEFCFRCVFCLIREQWGRTCGEFELDHFVPQSQDPHRAAEYENLLYSCTSCNVSKGNQVVPDPRFVLRREQVVVNIDGVLEGLTDDAKRLIRMIDLNDEEYCRWRRTWMRIIELAERLDPRLYEQLMGFPEDLPDLSLLRPPGGNTRPDGIGKSYFAQRQRGELPKTY